MEQTKRANFTADSLSLLNESGIPFMLGGTYAFNLYTGLQRPTKDMDIFCKPGDYPKILDFFARHGYQTEIEDERWIAKVKRNGEYFDVIFNSKIAITPVTEMWLKESELGKLLEVEVPLLPATELFFSKAFVQGRYHYDGNDIVHMILLLNDKIKWDKLLGYMDQYWEVLLVHIITFRFVYPSERGKVPDWVFNELLERLEKQRSLPLPETRVCRGRLLSIMDYREDVEELGFADIIGEENERKKHIFEDRRYRRPAFT